jgi:hypothetical protein
MRGISSRHGKPRLQVPQRNPPNLKEGGDPDVEHLIDIEP